jgi:hypothetical protein
MAWCVIVVLMMDHQNRHPEVSQVNDATHHVTMATNIRDIRIANS